MKATLYLFWRTFVHVSALFLALKLVSIGGFLAQSRSDIALLAGTCLVLFTTIAWLRFIWWYSGTTIRNIAAWLSDDEDL